MTRGEIWWVDFGYPVGSELGYLRPAVIVQTDVLNSSRLNTVIVAVVTSNLCLANYEGNVFLPKLDTGLQKDSMTLLAQLATVDKNCLIEKCSKVSPHLMRQADSALSFALAIGKEA